MKKRAVRLEQILSSTCTQDLDLADDFVVVDRFLASHRSPPVVARTIDNLPSYHPSQMRFASHALVRRATKRGRASATGDPWALIQCLW